MDIVYCRHIACGYNGDQPKVVCTDEVISADDERNADVISLRSGVIMGYHARQSLPCFGSLLYHELKEKSFSISKINRRKRSVDGNVFHVEGFERKRFRGASELYRPGVDMCPRLIVKSIRREDCP
ncbi:Uncharacterized protein FKW44_004193 [Caligus rogercresseyi]|uniref:Uncharacterized protein n=1 Tax=Caligus rogercresseyi TaxID=217165 RepID=A0A7T8HL83_CALRO|nr:Uncharacterized protein FKW44_004193 [Caligus rogercresseyi]